MSAKVSPPLLTFFLHSKPQKNHEKEINYKPPFSRQRNNRSPELRTTFGRSSQWSAGRRNRLYSGRFLLQRKHLHFLQQIIVSLYAIITLVICRVVQQNDRLQASLNPSAIIRSYCYEKEIKQEPLVFGQRDYRTSESGTASVGTGKWSPGRSCNRFYRLRCFLLVRKPIHFMPIKLPLDN